MELKTTPPPPKNLQAQMISLVKSNHIHRKYSNLTPTFSEDKEGNSSELISLDGHYHNLTNYKKKNYRLISLVNIQTKILNKMVAS